MKTSTGVTAPTLTESIRAAVTAALIEAHTGLARYAEHEVILPCVETATIERTIAAARKVTQASVLTAIRSMVRAGTLDMVCLGLGGVWQAVPAEQADVDWVRVTGFGGVPTVRQLVAMRDAGIGWSPVTAPAQVYSPAEQTPDGLIELGTMLCRPKDYLYTSGVGSRTAFLVDRADLAAFVGARAVDPHQPTRG
jgi:hypothetical protein